MITNKDSRLLKPSCRNRKHWVVIENAINMIEDLAATFPDLCPNCQEIMKRFTERSLEKDFAH